MALDIYSTPACSDEPERIFSQGSSLLRPQRRQMTGEHVQENLCLRSWQASGVVTLDEDMFDEVIRYGDGDYNTTDSDDEVVYHEREQL